MMFRNFDSQDLTAEAAVPLHVFPSTYEGVELSKCSALNLLACHELWNPDLVSLDGHMFAFDAEYDHLRTLTDDSCVAEPLATCCKGRLPSEPEPN
jgi:hypothetical protein